MEPKTAKVMEAEFRFVAVSCWEVGGMKHAGESMKTSHLRGISSKDLMYRMLTAVHLEVARRGDLKCSHHSNNKVVIV